MIFSGGTVWLTQSVGGGGVTPTPVGGNTSFKFLPSEALAPVGSWMSLEWVTGTDVNPGDTQFGLWFSANNTDNPVSLIHPMLYPPIAGNQIAFFKRPAGQVYAAYWQGASHAGATYIVSYGLIPISNRMIFINT